MSVSVKFSENIRSWLQENCPAEMYGHITSEDIVWGGRQEAFSRPKSKEWMLSMAEKGWLAPDWPVEYGGADFTQEESKELKNQMQSLGCCPPIMSLGIHMMGPTIMQFGTEVQKQEYLPKIAKGEIRWCQGYSEPDAGSDLASLRCRATLEEGENGEEWVVDGQKVWTSFADKSDYIFCLVRTDFSVKKHNGISVLLVDMDSPGVSVKPINLISGSSHFCEVFFDNVRVPKANLLGELNSGWTIAKVMLQHERNMMGQSDMGDAHKQDLVELGRCYLEESDGKLTDSLLRAQIAKNQMDFHLVDSTSARIAAEIKAGEHGLAASILKYTATHANQDKYELLLNIVGNRALGWSSNKNFNCGDIDMAGDFSERELDMARQWALSKVQTIGGGTSEIQLNIIAKHILGLPV